MSVNTEDLICDIHGLLQYIRRERERRGCEINNDNNGDDFQYIHRIRSVSDKLRMLLSACEVYMVEEGGTHQTNHNNNDVYELKELISDHRFVFGLFELMLLKTNNVNINDHNHLFPIYWEMLIINFNFAEIPTSGWGNATALATTERSYIKHSCISTSSESENEEVLFHLQKVITILFRNAIIDFNYGNLLAAAMESAGRKVFMYKCKDDIRTLICQSYIMDRGRNIPKSEQTMVNDRNNEGRASDNHNISTYFTDDVCQQIPFYIVSAAVVEALATFPLHTHNSDLIKKQCNNDTSIKLSYHPSVPQLGQLLRLLVNIKQFSQATCSLLPHQLIEVLLLEHNSCNVGSSGIFNHLSLLPLVSTSQFQNFCVIGMLLECASLTVSTCQAAEAWSCVGSLFVECKSSVAACLLANFEEFVHSVVSKLGDTADMSSDETQDSGVMCDITHSKPPLYVQRRELLKLLSVALGDPAYKKARTRLADCPALFVAVLRVVETLPNPLEEKITRHRRIQRLNQQLNSGLQHDRSLLSTGNRKYGGRPQELSRFLSSTSDHNNNTSAVVDLYMGNTKGLKGADGDNDDEEDPFCLSPAKHTGFSDAMLLYDCYHVLKVILVKPKKNLCIRHIVSSNRDALMTFVQHYHESRIAAAQLIDENNAGFLMSGVGDVRGSCSGETFSLARQEAKLGEEEKKLIISQIAKVTPLSAEELLTLRHFVSHRSS